jgi:tetratricopeptide (TPR) repeat protein
LRYATITLLILWTAIVPIGRGQAAGVASVQLIVVGTIEEANTVLDRLQKGDDFAALARARSIDPTANDGGIFQVNPDDLRPDLRDALRAVQPGQITGIVKIPAGYAILRLVKEAPAATSAEVDRTRALAVTAPPSVRLTPGISGYSEFYEALRSTIPTGEAGRNWAIDLKGVCAARKLAPSNAIATLRNRLAHDAAKMEPLRLAYTHYTLAELLSAQGDFENSIKEWEIVYRDALSSSNSELAQHMEAVLGAGYLHRASSDYSTHGPIDEGRIFPAHPGAMHLKPGDVEKAIEYLTKALKREPANGELQWLLNVAYMTQGSYPSKVPKDYLIPPAVFASKENLGRFLDVAPAAGLNIFGMAGGAIIDDFDNDGLLDVVTSEVDDCAPLHYFHNNGDGTFTNRTKEAGLANQLGGLNIIQADYNNDGCVDILVLRGGWEFGRRRSLLRNDCDGTFTDVTAESGLLAGPVLPSQTAVWLDIDNDGNLDLFIGNENGPGQLFRNKGDGTFVEISHQAGVDQVSYSKAVVSADYDNDGYPDLFVSNYNGPDFLYHNNGDGTFTEVSQKAGLQTPWLSFAAWFFDYDNDGWPDLFVTGYYFSIEEVAHSYMGLPRKGETLKLFKNMRDGTFKDVTAETGLDRVFMPMGANFGDIDNDGFLDIYLGMGNPSYTTLMPNVLLHNQEGKRFVDITTSSGTGALAKGHGVAFADLNNDGDEDLFIVMGGPDTGDRYTARLFENPGGHGNDWITLHMVGMKSNRSAIGARITVTVENEGHKRTISRTVGSGGSFGASPFQQHIGLGKSAHIDNIEVWWPASKTKQNFTDIKPNQFLEIKEFEKAPKTLTRHTFRLGGAARKTGS